MPILRFSCHHRYLCCEKYDGWRLVLPTYDENECYLRIQGSCFGQYIRASFLRSDDVTMSEVPVMFLLVCTHGILLFRNYKTWAEIHQHNVRQAHTVKIVSTYWSTTYLFFVTHCCWIIIILRNWSHYVGRPWRQTMDLRGSLVLISYRWNLFVMF